MLELVEAANGIPLVIVGDGPFRERVPGARGFVAARRAARLYGRAAVVAVPRTAKASASSAPRRWRTAGRSSRARSAGCSTSSPTARRASTCRPATLPRCVRPSSACSPIGRCVSAWARPAACACASGSRGRPSPTRRSRRTKRLRKGSSARRPDHEPPSARKSRAVQRPLETRLGRPGAVRRRVRGEVRRVHRRRARRGHELVLDGAPRSRSVALGVGPGDEVIIPAFTWVCDGERRRGARRASRCSCDVDLDTYNLDVAALEPLVTRANGRDRPGAPVRTACRPGSRARVRAASWAVGGRGRARARSAAGIAVGTPARSATAARSASTRASRSRLARVECSTHAERRAGRTRALAARPRRLEVGLQAARRGGLVSARATTNGSASTTGSRTSRGRSARRRWTGSRGSSSGRRGSPRRLRRGARRPRVAANARRRRRARARLPGLRLPLCARGADAGRVQRAARAAERGSWPRSRTRESRRARARTRRSSPASSPSAPRTTPNRS